ncbi:MAG: DNA polymerase III subunit beta [Oscillospiraceae bacterium]|nr:DNA polymerase III subunit beta [Oscillospiraceae bacterium]
MKFICKQSEINEALANVTRAVPPKSPISALEGVKLYLGKGELELTGYDLELGIQTRIPVVSDDVGEFILNSKLFSEIIRKMPSENIEIEVDENLTTIIRGDSAEYKILAMPADEYPSIPDYDTGDNFTVPQAMLKNMINQTIFAVAVTDNKPVLMGELFDIMDYGFNLVAIDGYRLAVRSEKIESDNHYNFVVKAKALSEVSKLLKDSDGEKVTMHVSKKHITFEIGKYMVLSRLLEGEFHNYKGSIPASHATEIIINTRDFIASLERCMLLINEKAKAPVRCIFKDNMVKISCSTALGKLNDEMEADTAGPSVEIGFNCRYLLDALKAAESDKVKLQLNGGLSPMKIVPLQGNAYTFLVLPMRLKSE